MDLGKTAIKRWFHALENLQSRDQRPGVLYRHTQDWALLVNIIHSYEIYNYFKNAFIFYVFIFVLSAAVKLEIYN